MKGSCRGLGFSFSWEEWAQERGILSDDYVVDREAARALASEGMPATAGTVQLMIGGKVPAAA